MNKLSKFYLTFNPTRSTMEVVSVIPGLCKLQRVVDFNQILNPIEIEQVKMFLSSSLPPNEDSKS